ncbi:hypothetical protein [Salinispora arenicola]|uniref:hypothetical protein n=1 Tax=Salinispora arenicola TaxID=168697 RepID=UPI0027E38FCE|nr:hypothetical protein [Salinispora arenicola]
MGMAFRELEAMQAAYDLLSPLEASAQQRVIAWLSAALADTNGAPMVVDELTLGKPVADVHADITSKDSAPTVLDEHAAAGPEVQTAAPTVSVAPVAAAEPEVTELEPAPQRPKRGRPAKATGRRAARSVSATKPAVAAPGRRGERPSGEQYLADLAAAGSFKALAEKYGKSVGTIGNWANQLREKGFDIPVGRQKRS